MLLPPLPHPLRRPVVRSLSSVSAPVFSSPVMRPCSPPPPFALHRALHRALHAMDDGRHCRPLAAATAAADGSRRWSCGVPCTDSGHESKHCQRREKNKQSKHNEGGKRDMERSMEPASAIVQLASCRSPCMQTIVCSSCSRSLRCAHMQHCFRSDCDTVGHTRSMQALPAECNRLKRNQRSDQTKRSERGRTYKQDAKRRNGRKEGEEGARGRS